MSRRAKRLVIAAAVIGVIVAIPIVAFAVPTFTDVPESHPFYDEIEAIKKAGITQGSNECDPAATPAYCPESKVRRDAMAAFMERGFGRLAGADATPVVDDSVAETTLATTEVTAGAAGAGTNGYVLLNATGWVLNFDFISAGAGNCPCLAVIEIRSGSTTLTETPVLVSSFSPFGSFSSQAIAPIMGDTTGTYSVVASIVDGDVSLTETVGIDLQLTATYVPFDGDATNASSGIPSSPAALVDSVISSAPSSLSQLKQYAK